MSSSVNNPVMIFLLNYTHGAMEASSSIIWEGDMTGSLPPDN